MKNKNQAPELRELFSTAQYYHMVHSVAMLSLPLVKRPLLVLFHLFLSHFCVHS